MAILRIHLHKIHQKSQNYGSTDSTQDHMSAEVLFDLEDESGKRFDGMRASVANPWGSRFEEEPFEVGPPIGPEGPYRGPFNHMAFKEGVERYVRNLIGTEGRGIHIDGSSNVTMINVGLSMPATFEIDVRDLGPAW